MNSGISANSATNTHGDPEATRPTAVVEAADEVHQRGLDVARVVAQRRGRLGRRVERAVVGARAELAPDQQRVGALDPGRVVQGLQRRVRRRALGRALRQHGDEDRLAAVADRLLERGRVDLARRLGRRVDVDVGRVASADAAASTSCARAAAGSASSSTTASEDGRAWSASQYPAQPLEILGELLLQPRPGRRRSPSALEPVRPWRRASGSAASRCRTAPARSALSIFTPLVSARISTPLGGS